MEELKLRGYVCPEDFEGSDAERIQKAIDTAEQEDIRKVVLCGSYGVDRTLLIPDLTEIVFSKDTTLAMTGEGPLFRNRVAVEEGKNSWSFENSRIYLKAEGPVNLVGDLCFWHAKYIVLEALQLQGKVFFEFCREVRMERDEILGRENAVVIGRGCNNFIMQYLKAKAEKSVFVLDPRIECGPYVIGKDAEIHEIILRDSELQGETAVTLGASGEYGVFNCQIDHITTDGTGVVIGDGSGLPSKRFFNLSATDLKAGKEERVLKNEVKHCYFGE